MIREAIDRVLDLARPPTVEVGGVTYWDDAQHQPVQPPLYDTIHTKSLRGFVDYLAANVDRRDLSRALIRMVDHRRVTLESAERDSVRCVWREVYCCATCDRSDQFPYGEFLPVEQFIIRVQSQMEELPGRAELLRYVGNLRAEKVLTQRDDGVTQLASVRIGVATVEQMEAPNPVVLAPRRTFAEVSQPASAFILRLRGGDTKETPRCALFEADGGLWQEEARHEIARWLEEQLEKIEIPIIA